MSRKLYSIDYWGHVQRDRRAEKNAAKGAGIGLMGKTVNTQFTQNRQNILPHPKTLNAAHDVLRRGARNQLAIATLEASWLLDLMAFSVVGQGPPPSTRLAHPAQQISRMQNLPRMHPERPALGT
jgi:hypothetical protein